MKKISVEEFKREITASPFFNYINGDGYIGFYEVHLEQLEQACKECGMKYNIVRKQLYSGNSYLVVDITENK